MSRRTQIIVLVGLVILLAIVYVRNRNDVPGFGGVLAANSRFVPIDVQEPNLRLDLLAQTHRSTYNGSNRNIFDITAVPVKPQPGQPGQSVVAQEPPHVGDIYPQKPPPPPPPHLPAQFFGYETRPGSTIRVGFFLSGDDVIVAAEGDTLMGNFRLLHIGNDSADIEEISTGRHFTVALEQPPGEASPS
ncbi:MAG TPA: hypothetical protein VLY23_14170 [Candidatus Acidoferrum sp.]|nr:hypothetical protein [Candidatus Acidoferrum sp.]